MRNPISAIRKLTKRFRNRKFRRVKQVASGRLASGTYRELYRVATKLEPGCIVEIGPAQGASTISLALGARENAHPIKLFTIERGEASQALASATDVDMNRRAIESNLEAFGVRDAVEIVIGDVADVHPETGDGPISLLCIDADGALDRDFRLFFNRLVDGAPIVIDDCLDVINDHARNRYLKWTEPEELEEYVRGKGATHFRDLCPLGKEYTTYRFVQYFLEQGLLSDARDVRRTLFARKAVGARFDEEKHGPGLERIRDQIEAEYLERNPVLAERLESI